MTGIPTLVVGAAAKLSGVGKLLAKVPWQVWAGLAALAALLIGVHMHGNAVGRAISAAKAEQRSQDSQAVQSAQAKATALLAAQKQATEARYATLATQKDQEYASQLNQARAAAARYIATHSVRPAQASGGTGQAAATANDHGSSVPPAMPADSVVVSAEDVQQCTAATSYAIAAHDWALGLKQATK